MARGENDHIVLKSQVKKIFKKLNHPWKCLHLEGVGHHDVEVMLFCSPTSAIQTILSILHIVLLQTSHDYLDGLVEFVDYLMPKGTTIKSEIVVPSNEHHIAPKKCPYLKLTSPISRVLHRNTKSSGGQHFGTRWHGTVHQPLYLTGIVCFYTFSIAVFLYFSYHPGLHGSVHHKHTRGN